MHRKESICRKILLALFLINGLSCSKEDPQVPSEQRVRRQADPEYSIVSTVTLVNDFISRLKDNFDDKSITETEDIVLQLFSSFPIIGDIAALFHDDETTFEQSVLHALGSLSSKLEELSTDIHYIKEKLTSMPSIIQISIIQKQVAEDARELDACFTDYIHFLKKPTSNAEVYRMKQCYGKIVYLRDLGNILKGTVVTFENKPLFHELIENRGYCNGTEIVTIFTYIYGLYLEGCASLTMSERLTFNDSKTYLFECNTTSKEIIAFLRSLYNSCMNDKTCDESKEKQLIADVLSSTRTSNEIHTACSRLFPWYYFIVTIARSVSITIDKSRRVSQYASKLANGQISVKVLWFPYQYGKFISEDTTFEMKITKCSVLTFRRIDLKLSHRCSYTDDKDVSVTGNFTDKSTFISPYVPCSFVESTQNEPVIQSDGGLSAGQIAGIVIGCLVVFLVLIGLFLYTCRK